VIFDPMFQYPPDPMRLQYLLFFSLVSHIAHSQSLGPEGGLIKALAVKDNTIFAGSWAGGIFRSTDNGSTWAAVDKA